MRTALPFRAALLTTDAHAHTLLPPLLTADPEFTLVGTASDDRDAVLRQHCPDVAFLDADDDTLGYLGSEARPRELHPILLARSERHAARAFEVGAVDYLLAPLSEARLLAALERFKQRARADRVEHLNRQLSAVLGQLQGDRSPAPSRRPPYLDRIPIKEHDLVRFVSTDEVIWIEAAGNYVLLHLTGKSHMLLETMQEFEARLDPARFLRIHRSRIVNLEFVEALSPLPYGEYRLHLRSGTAITSSRSRSANLARALGL